MRFSLLGPIEITHCDQQIQLIGHHQRALVGALASEAGRVISAERLIDMLWGEHPPTTARAKLHGYVSGVRRAISAFGPGRISAGWPLVTRAPGYMLSLDGVTIDLFEYRALVKLAAAELDAGQIAAASRHLGEALALWRGSAFADAATPALSNMAAAFERGRLLAVERKAECDLQLGRFDAVAEELTLVLAAHPLREGAWAALMLALYRRGCRAEALESYRIARRLLHDQLGVEPGQLLQRLHALMLSDHPQLSARSTLARLGEATGREHNDLGETLAG
jgi:DNA-binding SARP family transcriptional activator